MIKKICVVFILALSLQVITGCCDCEPSKKVYFTKKGLSLQHLDAALPQPMVTTASIIPSAKYGIQLQLRTAEIALRKQQINWGLIQTAQACKCAGNELIPKENILSIEIFSNNDFDASHPRNTDLSLYFKVKKYNTMVPLAEYIKSLINNQYMASTAFFEGVFLQVAPSVANKHKFRLKIALSDGRILEAETTEVELI